MKLGVIGEPCIDYIHHGDKVTKHPGGILYSVISLAVIAHNDKIYPIMNLGEDEYESISGILSAYGNINQDYIKKVEHKTRVVNLYYDTLPLGNSKKTYDREENSTEPTLPVSYKHISGILKELDGLLVNMVSGVDITLETFKEIRNNFKNYIHLDLHNLVMDTLPDGQRLQRKLNNWKEWCTIPNTIQMNESEAAVMTGESLSEYDIVEQILQDGNENNESNLKAMIITRGKTGVTMLQRKLMKTTGEVYYETNRTDLAGTERNDFKDSTGCGDVFASSFFYINLLHKGNDLHAALNYANKMAGRNGTLMGTEELYKLVS
jgi:hypothetical protein